MRHGDGGKGDARRPQQVPDAEVAATFEKVQNEPETKPCGCKKWSLSCKHKEGDNDNSRD